MVRTYALTAHLRTSFNSAPQSVCTYVHTTGVAATVFHASSSKHISPQWSWQTSRRRHHDARQCLRPAQIHQHSSDTKTPLRYAAKTQCCRRSRRTPHRLRDPPTSINSKKRRPQVGERRWMPPSSNPGDPDLGFPLELPGLVDRNWSPQRSSKPMPPRRKWRWTPPSIDPRI
jgi:hypothetical protein